MRVTRTGRLSQIPGRSDLEKVPFTPPPGSYTYWDESGNLMLRMPDNKYPHPCKGDMCENNPCCEDVL